MGAFDGDKDEFGDEDPGEDGPELKFECPCGRPLAVPVEMAGSVMECPWCTKEIRVPGGAEESLDEESPAQEADASTKSPSRCPSCAAICDEDECPACHVRPLAAADWEFLPYAEDQHVVTVASADWVLRRARWLLSKQTRREFFARPLLLPTEEFFPRKWSSDPAALEDLVEHLRGYAGLHECPVRVEVKDEVTSLGQQGLGVGGSFAAGCIFAPQWNDGEALIQVETASLWDRHDLVATLSHELGHLFGFVRLDCIESPPEDNEELTDLIAAMHGSGVFVCQGAQNFHRGWAGYLSQPELAFALALFCAVRGIGAERVAPHLTIDPRTFFQDALRFLESTPAAVREVSSALR